MNMLRFATVTTAAALLVGLSLGMAQAQTGIYSPATFTVGTSGSVTASGFGSPTYIVNGIPASATLSLSGTSTGISEAAGIIDDSLTGVDVTITAGANVTTITGATGNLIVNGDLVSFNDATIGASSSPYGSVTSLSFNFTSSTTPAITGTTVVAGPPPVIINGTFTSSFTGNNGVVSASYVPEPGVVSLLAGLAVVGTSLGLRRRRIA